MAKPDIVNALIRSDGRVYRDAGTHQPELTTISGIITVSGHLQQQIDNIEGGSSPWEVVDEPFVTLVTSTNRVGIAAVEPQAKLDVVQDVVDSSRSVLRLEQTDTDAAFIDLIGTEAIEDDGNISTSIEEEGLFSIIRYIRVRVNGTTYWMPVYELVPQP